MQVTMKKARLPQVMVRLIGVWMNFSMIQMQYHFSVMQSLQLK
jgi:hypothetical protein